MEKELEQLKNKINNYLSLDDEIMYILYNLKKEGDVEVLFDKSLWQLAFYEMKGVSNNLLISNLNFDLNGVIPFSEELDETIFRLEISGLLPYYINNDVMFDLSHINITKVFDEEKRSELDKGSEILRKFLFKE